MGCVRPPNERELSGAPPHSPKKRIRFRRKHKGKKHKKVELDQEEFDQQRIHELGERAGEDEEDEEKESLIEMAEADYRSRHRPHAALHSAQLIPSRNTLYSNTLSPGSVSSRQGSLLASNTLEVSPKPSPAWKGVFCFPGEEDTVSAIVDVSSIPSQTTSTTPVNTVPTVDCTTPGGGRVCRVKEKVQGVLEKPWILRQKKEKSQKGKAEREMKCGKAFKEGPEGTDGLMKTPSQADGKGVVHIREVDGKLCVVRTVYPSDFGSPVWRGDTNSDFEVCMEPPVPSPVTANAIKVKLFEEDACSTENPSGHYPMPRMQTQTEVTGLLKGFSLDTPGRAQEPYSLLESGYASDLPLTSPETAGTTPSQTDWGGLTSSSSERLDTMVESPVSLQHQATVKYLPQVCLWNASCPFFSCFITSRKLCSIHVYKKLREQFKLCIWKSSSESLFLNLPICQQKSDLPIFRKLWGNAGGFRE